MERERRREKSIKANQKIKRKQLNASKKMKNIKK
jgi:hypothetical protein